MFNSKLIRLFQTLDESEIRQFKKWIKSPIHNQHSDVQNLFEFLFTRQSITEITTQRERVFQFLYPEELLNMARLRHLMSFSVDVLEDFMCYLEYISDYNNKEILLLRALRKRNLKKDAQKQEQSSRKLLKKQAIQNENYYWQQYQLEVEQFRLLATGDRPTNTNLQAVMDGSSLFFVRSTLRYACISITHQNLFKTSYTIPFLPEILKAIQEGSYAESNSIQLYYACYLALTKTDDEQSFQLLKKSIFRFSNSLSKFEFREVYEIALNYCIKLLNTGNRYYTEEAFDLYKKGIEYKILLDKDGYLSHFAYKNMVAIGLHLEKTAEIELFIPQGEFLLNPSYRANYIHYNTAKFHFATHAYTKAIQMLISMEYDDLFMTLDAKLMLLKIYVEEGSYDLIESYIPSFMQYIRRKTDMSYHQNGYLNTIRLTQKIIHAHSKEEKKLLIKEIENTSPLPEKRWLLNQLETKTN